MSEIINVFLFEEYDFDLDLLEGFISEINELQESFVFKFNRDFCLSLDPGKEMQDWSYLSGVLVNANVNKKYNVGILSKPIENNWLSAVDHGNNVSFITTSDWIYLSELPVYAYLLYEVLQNYQEMRLGKMIAHEETKGCMNDMCAYKLDISFKIKTGWVCSDCLMRWNDIFSLSEIEDVNKILDYIRFLALGRKHLWQISNKYPTPVAVRFRMMQAERNSYLKFLKMVDLYDATIRYVAFSILSTLTLLEAMPPTLSKNNQIVLNKNPTLATWESIIDEYCKSGLCEAIFVEKDNCSIKRINELVSQASIRESRNDYCGHNYTGQDLKEYYDLYISKIGLLKALLSECSESVFRYVLAKIEVISFEEGKPCLIYRRLVGDSVIFDSRELSVKNIPFDSSHLIMLDETTGKLISMHPYIKHAVCQTCNHERTLYRDGQYTGTGIARYIDTLIGHRTECI